MSAKDTPRRQDCVTFVRDRQEPPLESQPPGSSLRILVADDSGDTADSLAMLLEVLGHQARTARDGIAALEIAADFTPDVLFLDVTMPGMDGYEVGRRIRLEPWGADALLVAVTGWGHDDDRRRSREAGFDVHLVKPIDIGALRNLLRQRTTHSA